MQAGCLTKQIKRALDSICLWRNTVIRAPSPLPVPDTNEALRYIVSMQTCGIQEPHTIPEGNARRPNKGEGWRTIEGEQIWFKSPWHANMARFIASRAELYQGWAYQPKTFRIQFYGAYIPTFRVYSLEERRIIWLEADYDEERVKSKADVMDIFFPEEKVGIIRKDFMIKWEREIRKVIPEWE